MEEEVFISDLFELDDELDQLGVFDAIITTDSHFFINLLRLKNSVVPQFKDSYNKINRYFDNVMMLLDVSQEKGDKFYRTALRRFSFSGVKGINAKAEHTDQRIFVYVQTGNNPGRDKTIKEEHDKRQQNGQNPPLLYVIDSRPRTSASKR